MGIGLSVTAVKTDREGHGIERLYGFESQFRQQLYP